MKTRGTRITNNEWDLAKHKAYIGKLERQNDLYYMRIRHLEGRIDSLNSTVIKHDCSLRELQMPLLYAERNRLTELLSTSAGFPQDQINTWAKLLAETQAKITYNLEVIGDVEKDNAE